MCIPSRTYITPTNSIVNNTIYASQAAWVVFLFIGFQILTQLKFKVHSSTIIYPFNSYVDENGNPDIPITNMKIDKHRTIPILTSSKVCCNYVIHYNIITVIMTYYWV